MYDMVFISYQEANAEQNWQDIAQRFPRVKRLHGVKGLHRAHVQAAHMVDSLLFYVIDGDAVITEDFGFDYEVPWHQTDHVHVFRAKNPVNDLVYGYGAVKLLPTAEVKGLSHRDHKPDMTSSINRKYKIIHQLSNITRFNTDPFSAWRSGFRECAKLASGVIDGQVNEETQHRLHTWCTVGAQAPHGDWCMRGAKAGRAFALDSGSRDRMHCINDWAWLAAEFQKEL